jgi:glutamyl-tRNA synthetase
MHLGTMRTAYFNWLAARASGGKFLVRVDDTDARRNQEAVSKAIFTVIGWFGLDFDKQFCQSEYIDLYTGFALILLDKKVAIRLPNGAIALHNPELPEAWYDEIAGDIPITETNYEQIDKRLILLRGDVSNNSPTYQLASVVDDWDHTINYIIRGTDHISNTPKQIAIWNALNKCFPDRAQKLPKFAHVGLLFKDGKKLSKRDSSFSLSQYVDYNPEALLNFLLRLGWSPHEDNKANSLISKERAVEMFLTQGRMRNSQANVDEQKLKWFNKKYNRI